MLILGCRITQAIRIVASTSMVRRISQCLRVLSHVSTIVTARSSSGPWVLHLVHRERTNRTAQARHGLQYRAYQHFRRLLSSYHN
jgi:hypothetical protein